MSKDSSIISKQDATADHWPDLYKDEYAVARLKRSCQLLDSYPNMEVLDIGCHKNEAMDFLPIGVWYRGLDILKGHDFDGGFNEGKQYPRILCLETLEHLKYPRRTLQSIRDHLSMDGVLVVSLPNEATLFHRIRSLFGTVDMEAYSESGKHLHLPNIAQSRKFLKEFFSVFYEESYMSLGAGSRNEGIARMLRFVPRILLRGLSRLCPSLFARGVIYVCKKYALY